jgi:hypothetical protein
MVLINAANYNTGTGTYTDQSGNGNDVTSANKPTLNATSDGFRGKPRCLYDGVANWSETPALTQATPYTIALIGRLVGTIEPTSYAAGSRMFDATVTVGTLTQLGNGTSQIGLFNHVGGATICNNGSAEMNTPAVIILSFNGASSYVQINGGPKITGNINATSLAGSRITIASSFTGGSFFTNMELAAWGIWPRAFTTADTTQVLNLASAEYGIYRSWLYSLVAGIDSLTTGNGAPTVPNCWPQLLCNNLGKQWGYAKNGGIAGLRFPGANTTWAGGITGNNNNGDYSFDASFNAFVVADLGGHNDLVVDGVDYATLVARATTFNAGRQAAASAAGFTADIWQFGIPDSAVFSAGQLVIKNAFNAYIQTGAGQAALGIVGAVVDPALCADGAASGPYFQGDGIHFTQAGMTEQAAYATPLFAARYTYGP